MRSNVSRRLIFVGLLLIFALSGGTAYSVDMDSQLNNFFEQKSDEKFDLVSNFPTSAETMLVLPSFVKQGVWQEDRFVFPGAESATDMMLDQAQLAGELTEVIRCQPSPDDVKRIHFPHIAPGSKVLLYTLVSPIESDVPGPGGSSSDTGAVYLKIFAGAKLLKRTRVTASDGWVQTGLSLGSSRFLKKNLNLTVEISADSMKNIVTIAGFVT